MLSPVLLREKSFQFLPICRPRINGRRLLLHAPFSQHHFLFPAAAAASKVSSLPSSSSLFHTSSTPLELVLLKGQRGLCYLEARCGAESGASGASSSFNCSGHATEGVARRQQELHWRRPDGPSSSLYCSEQGQFNSPRCCSSVLCFVQSRKAPYRARRSRTDTRSRWAQTDNNALLLSLY